MSGRLFFFGLKPKVVCANNCCYQPLHSKLPFEDSFPRHRGVQVWIALSPIPDSH
jgi:hypothetical protein